MSLSTRKSVTKFYDELNSMLTAFEERELDEQERADNYWEPVPWCRCYQCLEHYDKD